MKRQHLRSAAFTLVELLVVIAIIAVLVSLLLPAVQSAREAARRTQCVNNLRQLGIAVQLYESAFKRLPAGAYWGGVEDDWMRGTILIRILPFLEEQALYDAFDLTAHNIHDQTLPTGELIASSPIPMFTCPSGVEVVENAFDGTGVAYSHYTASKGSTAVDNHAHPCRYVDEWNGIALAEYRDWDDTIIFSGPFCRRGIELKLQEISDGLSKTIFFGEVRPECARHVQSGWVDTGNGNGMSTTSIPMNWDNCYEGHEDPCRSTNNWNVQYGFKSTHPGGSNFLFGDVSTRWISEDVDFIIYQYLGARADGMSFTLP